jgi:general secretion pathway protein B
MSFILEALKKSEKKHEDTVVPNLHTVHGSACLVLRRKPLWPYLLVAGMLLNAGLLLWFLAPWVKSPATPVSLLSAEGSEDFPVAAVPPVTESSVLASIRELTPAPPVPPAVESPVVVSGEATAVAAPSVPAVSAVIAPPEPSVEKTPTVIEFEPVSPGPEERREVEPPIYAFAELPYAIQSRLPEIQVSVYAYSEDAASRLVRVNNRILREGSTLDVGLLLDEITPTELVFSFAGYRFRVPK